MFLIPYKNNPTIDIYFRAPLQPFISDGLTSNSRKPIRRIGPNCFFANNNVVVIRYVTRKEIEKIYHLKPDKLFYIVDDDFHGLEDDTSLPADYRHKLAQFAEQSLPAILKLADVVVSPSPQILQNYQSSQTLHLNPSYTSVCHDFSHFDNPPIIKILFGGSRSHLSDLHQISATLADLCRENPKFELTTFMGIHAPKSLCGIKNIIHRPAQPWRKHKQIMLKERFHIGLSPTNDTRFNRGRSINKILDHAAFGAAGMYSDLPPINQSIVHGKNGMLVKNDLHEWRQAIQNLAENIEQTRLMAKAGARLAHTVGDPASIRQFWAIQLFGKSHDAFNLLTDVQ